MKLWEELWFWLEFLTWIGVLTYAGLQLTFFMYPKG